MSTRRIGICAIAVMVATTLGACTTPTPQVIEKTVVVKETAAPVVQTVVVTQQVEKQVEKVITATPEAEPTLPGQPVDGGTLNVWAFDPPFDSLAGVQWIGNWQNTMPGWLIYDRLLYAFSDGSIQPQLAKSWDVSADGLTWTAHLRDDVKWHDGVPFSAEDVVWSLEAIFSPKLKPLQDLTGGIKAVKGVGEYHEGKADGIEGIKVVDPYTVEFTLTQPTPGFPFAFIERYRPTPKHLFKDVPLEKLYQSPVWYTNPVGTGPWKFVKYVPGQYLELARNDEYWGGKPHIEKIIFRFGPREAAMAMLRKGELDHMLGPSFGDLAVLRSDPNISLRTVEWAGMWHFITNSYAKDGFWRNPKARQALQYAVDIDSYVDKVLQGAGWRNTSWFAGTGYECPTLNEYPYDPEKAKQLLTEAGWNFKDWVLNIGFWPSAKERNDFFLILQASLAKIGVRAEVTSVDDVQEMDWLRSRDGERWDIYQGGQGVSPEPSYHMRDYFYGDAKNEFFHGWPFDSQQRPIEWAWNGNTIGKGINELIEQGEQETDPAKRVAIYQQLDCIFNEELPFGFVARVPMAVAFSSRVHGVTPQTDPKPIEFDYLFDTQNWWLWPQ